MEKQTRTPEKIKRGLECDSCADCPWSGEDGCLWSEDFALAYIQQLEREKAKLLEDMLIGPCCDTCKHIEQYRNVQPCATCFEVSLGSDTLNWEWRGVEE